MFHVCFCMNMPKLKVLFQSHKYIQCNLNVSSLSLSLSLSASPPHPPSPLLLFYPADPPEGNSLPTAGSTATPTGTSTTATSTPSTSSTAGGGGAGGGVTAAPGAAGGATALFPCLVYYPGSQNYSLIWVPMDGSNPIVSGANILSGSGTITLPTQVHKMITVLELELELKLIFGDRYI